MSIKVLTIAMLLAAFTALTACNTVKGGGKDIENAGESIQRTAERNK